MRVRRQRGTVERFDTGSGLGEITGADGTTYPFHATEIADGTRTIEVGAAVDFVVIAGHLGRWEASAVVPAGVRTET
jgi:cold shock CspA family protein